VRRWVPPLLALTALVLVPWTIWLATTLPSHEVAEHWDVAWAGFDAMLAAALLATALSAWHDGRFLQACAACAGTLLVVDAWFDLLTSSGRPTGSMWSCTWKEMCGTAGFAPRHTRGVI